MNPPAFPIPRHTRHFDDSQGAYMQDDGMTLRDYFAAKAMNKVNMNSYSTMSSESYEQYIARHAYRLADAMMKERES